MPIYYGSQAIDTIRHRELCLTHSYPKLKGLYIDEFCISFKKLEKQWWSNYKESRKKAKEDWGQKSLDKEVNQHGVSNKAKPDS